MSTKINDNSMSLEIDGRVIATAEFSKRAAADGHGAWIVSCPGQQRDRGLTPGLPGARRAGGRRRAARGRRAGGVR